MLRGIVVEIKELNKVDIEAMFSLMSTYYDNMRRENFISDLKKKDNAILLKDEGGNIKGFTTVMFCKITVGCTPVNLLFSGDTIIRHDFWSNNDLMPLWINFALHKATSLEGGLYWLLISKGYKTYKYLTSLYKDYYPKLNVEIPEFEKNVVDEFCSMFYPEQYDKNNGLILGSKDKDYLKEEFAQIPENKLRDKHVKFFLEKNPHYAKGDELVCITLLSKENLNKIGRKILGA